MTKIGDIVFYNDPGSEFGTGDTVWPAIVTRVHSEHSVNLTIFSDDGPRAVASRTRDGDSSGPIVAGRWRQGPFVE